MIADNVYEHPQRKRRFLDTDGNPLVKITPHLLKTCGFPKRLMDVRLAEMTRDTYLQVKGWIDEVDLGLNPDRGLIFMGKELKDVEVAFTVALNSCLMRNYSVFCISSYDLIDFIINNPEKNQYEAHEFLKNVDFLGIYDFGFEEPSPLFKSILGRMIRARNLELNRTLIATCLTREQFFQRYADAPTVIECFVNISSFVRIG